MTWLIALAIYQFFGFLAITRLSLRYGVPNDNAEWLACVICYAVWPIIFFFDASDPHKP